MKTLRRFSLFSLAAFIAASCAGLDPAPRATALTDPALWRGWKQTDVPAGWVVEGDTIHLARPGAGDLITRALFDDFVLELSWRIEPGGNSGIFFHATEEGHAIYESAPELQLLDDAAFPDTSPLNQSGANYALHPTLESALRPSGAWNDVRLSVEGSTVVHSMNGVELFRYELWSPEWEALVAASKFAAWPIYGRAKTGHIGLQDHGAQVWFKNVRVTRL